MYTFSVITYFTDQREKKNHYNLKPLNQLVALNISTSLKEMFIYEGKLIMCDDKSS